MTRVALIPAAAFEIAEAAAAYDATRPGMGSAFVRCIDRTIIHIRQFPEIAPAIEQDFRRAVIHRFPFCIVYRATPDEVQVLALFPTQADPGRLLARLSAPAAS